MRNMPARKLMKNPTIAVPLFMTYSVMVFLTVIDVKTDTNALARSRGAEERMRLAEA